MAIAPLHYGLLCANEVRKVTLDGVTLKDNPKEIELTFFHARKIETKVLPSIYPPHSTRFSTSQTLFINHEKKKFGMK